MIAVYLLIGLIAVALGAFIATVAIISWNPPKRKGRHG